MIKADLFFKLGYLTICQNLVLRELPLSTLAEV